MSNSIWRFKLMETEMTKRQLSGLIVINMMI